MASGEDIVYPPPNSPTEEWSSPILQPMAPSEPDVEKELSSCEQLDRLKTKLHELDQTIHMHLSDIYIKLDKLDKRVSTLEQQKFHFVNEDEPSDIPSLPEPLPEDLLESIKEWRFKAMDEEIRLKR